MMTMQAPLTNERVREVIDNIISRRSINRLDQKIFMSALLSKEKLSQEDQKMVDQVYQGLQSGLIRVVE